MGNFQQEYGRFEARIKIPAGQGLWPAFWMLGDDIDTNGWPQCGEVDIMENIGKEPGTVHGSLHGPGYSGSNPLTASSILPGGAKLSDEFHLFAVEWEASEVRFYLDSTLYETRTPADIPMGDKWVYDHPFFILLNVAVGGSWPGDPDETTIFPQTMLVDYVRVYTKS
jgi:beta-glucanase (GH16 family)